MQATNLSLRILIFNFLEIIVMLNIVLCDYWPFVYILWGKFYSSALSFNNWDYWFCLCCWVVEILTIWGSLKFLMKRKMDFSISARRTLGFDGDCVKYVDSLRSSNKWTCTFSLICVYFNFFQKCLEDISIHNFYIIN